jgi:hypothetical protein
MVASEHERSRIQTRRFQCGNTRDLGAPGDVDANAMPRAKSGWCLLALLCRDDDNRHVHAHVISLRGDIEASLGIRRGINGVGAPAEAVCNKS